MHALRSAALTRAFHVIDQIVEVRPGRVLGAPCRGAAASSARAPKSTQPRATSTMPLRRLPRQRARHAGRTAACCDRVRACAYPSLWRGGARRARARCGRRQCELPRRCGAPHTCAASGGRAAQHLGPSSTSCRHAALRRASSLLQQRAAARLVQIQRAPHCQASDAPTPHPTPPLQTAAQDAAPRALRGGVRRSGGRPVVLARHVLGELRRRAH
jgi:hypothetical protein